MKAARTIIAEVEEAVARQRVEEYFRQAGYEAVSSEPFLTFRRSTKGATWVAFSPRWWGAEATVQVEAMAGGMTEVTARLDISTTGQLFISEAERAFWQAELDGLERAVLTGSADHDRAEELSSRSVRQNIVSLAAWVVIMAFGMLLFEWLPFGALLGLLLGAVAAWAVVRWYDRGQRIRV